MVNDIAAIARQRAQAAVGRVARPAAFGIVAGVFFLFAVAALFYALFFWLEPLYGPPVAALIVAAVALVLGLLATAPLIVGRRRPEPAAPPASGATLPQVVSLLAQSASSLGPKQSAVTAVVLAVALGFMARGSARRKT
jgi:Putative Actinobacterial Holin-X, holin superfamily III